MTISTSDRDTVSRESTQHFLHPKVAQPARAWRGNDTAPAAPSYFAFENSLVLPSLQDVKLSKPAQAGKGVSALTVAGLLHALPTGVLILDSHGRVNKCNPAAERLLGSGLQDEFWRDVIAANFNPRDDDGHEVSLISGKRVSLMTRSLLGGEGQLIVINDLTETRELQNQLNRHQRLSVMGQMMSSLAHQIRTPLSAALLHADNLLARAEVTAPAAESGKKIISRLHSIERQIQDMLIFAKGGATPSSELSLDLLVAKFKDAATDLANSHAATIHWQDGIDQAQLQCNPDALVGAFLNLVENAIQSSDGAAEVSISIQVLAGDTPYQDSTLSIQIQDNGNGIPAALQASLAEPFNTTKANGTGLGLAIVKLVCKSHGGSFKFLPSEIGACAEISLPLCIDGGSL